MSGYGTTPLTTSPASTIVTRVVQHKPILRSRSTMSLSGSRGGSSSSSPSSQASRVGMATAISSPQLAASDPTMATMTATTKASTSKTTTTATRRPRPCFREDQTTNTAINHMRANTLSGNKNNTTGSNNNKNNNQTSSTIPTTSDNWRNQAHSASHAPHRMGRRSGPTDGTVVTAATTATTLTNAFTTTYASTIADTATTQTTTPATTTSTAELRHSRKTSQSSPIHWYSPQLDRRRYITAIEQSYIKLPPILAVLETPDLYKHWHNNIQFWINILFGTVTGNMLWMAACCSILLGTVRPLLVMTGLVTLPPLACYIHQWIRFFQQLQRYPVVTQS